MDIIGTLILPTCGKEYVFPEWKKNLLNLNLMKDQMKVVLCDATGGTEIGLKCAEVVKGLGFAKCYIESFKQTPTPNNRQSWKHFMTAGEKCAETIQAGMYHTEGDLILFLEDDVIVHPDTYNVLIDRFIANDSIGIMSACTFKKKTGNKTDVIAGDGGRILLSDNDPLMMMCDWVATGCFVTHGNIARHFDWKDSVVDMYASPDIAYCRHIKENHNMLVYMATDVRTKHIYERDGVTNIIGEIKCPIRPRFTGKIAPYKTTQTKDRTIDAPIFIVSYSGRAGSTFIQRIISSHDRVTIYGEPQGALNTIFNFATKMFEINNKGITRTGKDQYKRYGHKGWIANNPPQNINIVDFKKNQIDNFYDIGETPIWGIKVIEWNTRMVTKMHRLYPDATFIFLHRNMEDVYTSYLHRKNWWSEGAFDRWVENYNQLSEMSLAVPVNMHRIDLDFDDAKIDLRGMCTMLEKELKIELGFMDRSMLNQQVSCIEDANNYYKK